jgi:hypothetical protein
MVALIVILTGLALLQPAMLIPVIVMLMAALAVWTTLADICAPLPISDERTQPVDTAALQALTALDAMSTPVSAWENRFLLRLKRQGGGALTEEQRYILARLVEKYLDNPHLAATILGQMVLL